MRQRLIALGLLLACALPALAGEVICPADKIVSASYEYAEGTEPVEGIESHLVVEDGNYVFNCPPGYRYTYTGQEEQVEGQAVLVLVFTLTR